MVRPSPAATPETGPAWRPIAPTSPDGRGHRPFSWGFPEWFAVAQVAGPALLFLPGSQPFRVLLRVGTFGISLLGLAMWMRRPRVTRRHPACLLLVLGAGYMMLMLLHPGTNTLMAGLAQIGMHLAVAAPLLWAPPYFLGDPRRLARVLTILWIFNGASAVVGILQARDPGTWMPSEFSSVVTQGRFGVSALAYRGSDGQMVVRPPGLGDSPGAACSAGMFVASIGLAYLGLPVSNLRRLLGLTMGMAGVTVIFLTHVRTSLVIVVGSAVVYLVILVMQRRAATALVLAGSMAACGVGVLPYAASLGGKSTVDRFASLLEDDPLTVYDRSERLGMVTNTFDTLIVDHPFGAGLGRYGMMRVYFGDENNDNSPRIWAEVQLPAWVLDGGVVLLSLYLIAIVVAVKRLFQLSLAHRSYVVRQWAAVIIMLSAGPIALLFSYAPFCAQIGMQFWLLIGALEGIAQGEPPGGRAARQ